MCKKEEKYQITSSSNASFMMVLSHSFVYNRNEPEFIIPIMTMTCQQTLKMRSAIVDIEPHQFNASAAF